MTTLREAPGRRFMALKEPADYLTLLRRGDGATLRELSVLSENMGFREHIRDAAYSPFIVSKSLGVYPGHMSNQRQARFAPGRSVADRRRIYTEGIVCILDGSSISVELADRVTAIREMDMMQGKGKKQRPFVYFDSISPEEVETKDKNGVLLVIFKPNPINAEVAHDLPMKRDFTYTFSQLFNVGERQALVYEGYDSRVGLLAHSFDSKGKAINMYSSPVDARFGLVVADAGLTVS